MRVRKEQEMKGSTTRTFRILLYKWWVEGSGDREKRKRQLKEDRRSLVTSLER